MIGPQDIWVALALGMFLFGARKLPELSRSLGQAFSEFRKGVSGTEAHRYMESNQPIGKIVMTG
jgi:TatA/E family protein of Tat protein translocase